MNEQPAKPRGRAGLWIAVILLTIALLSSIAVNGGLLLGIMMHLAQPFEDEPVDANPSFNEIWSYGDGEAKAVRIAIDGVIFREQTGGLFSEPVDKVELIKQQILAARVDDDVDALILEINSPGGSVTASDEIYAELMRFKKSREGRLILVYMKDLAASGGYYAAAAGDWLIAEPTSVIGSIGVIMQALNIKDLSEKIGLSDTTIKSGANKDLLNPFHEVNPEHVTLLQGLVDNMYSRFYTIVKESRGMSDEQLEPLADGRVFTSDGALDNGLIDQVGYWDDVLLKLNELLGHDSVKIIRYETEPGFWEAFLDARLPSLSTRSFIDAQTPRMLYLWKP